MKLLLDESLPRRLAQDFEGHEVVTVPQQGWAGKGNGELLELASHDFDVFITADQNLQYQQNLAGANIAIVVLVATSNRYADLESLVPRAFSELNGIAPGQVVLVSA